MLVQKAKDTSIKCIGVSAHFLTIKYNGIHPLVCLGLSLDDFLRLYFSFVVNQCFGHIPTFVCAERRKEGNRTLYFEICIPEVVVVKGWTANCRFVVVQSS